MEFKLEKVFQDPTYAPCNCDFLLSNIKSENFKETMEWLWKIHKTLDEDQLKILTESFILQVEKITK